MSGNPEDPNRAASTPSPVQIRFYTNDQGWVTVDPNIPLSQQPIAASWLSGQPTDGSQPSYRAMFVESATFPFNGQPQQRGILLSTGLPNGPVSDCQTQPTTAPPSHPFLGTPPPPGFNAPFPPPMVHPWGPGGFNGPPPMPPFPMFHPSNMTQVQWSEGQTNTTQVPPPFPPPFPFPWMQPPPWNTMNSTMPSPQSPPGHTAQQGSTEQPSTTAQQNTTNNHSNPTLYYDDPSTFDSPVQVRLKQNSSELGHEIHPRTDKFQPLDDGRSCQDQSETNFQNVTPTFRSPDCRRGGFTPQARFSPPVRVSQCCHQQMTPCEMCEFQAARELDPRQPEVASRCLVSPDPATSRQFCFNECVAQARPYRIPACSAMAHPDQGMWFDNTPCTQKCFVNYPSPTSQLPPPPHPYCTCLNPNDFLLGSVADQYSVIQLNRTKQNCPQPKQVASTENPLNRTIRFAFIDMNATHPIEAVDLAPDLSSARQTALMNLQPPAYSKTDSTDSLLTAFVMRASKELDRELHRLKARGRTLR